jgi:hypothetical protein
MQNVSRQRYTTPETHSSTTTMRNRQRGRIRLSRQKKTSVFCHGRKFQKLYFYLGATCTIHDIYIFCSFFGFFLTRSGPNCLAQSGAKARQPLRWCDRSDAKCIEPGHRGQATPSGHHGRSARAKCSRPNGLRPWAIGASSRLFLFLETDRAGWQKLGRADQISLLPLA